MKLKEEQQRMTALLKDTITLLCKNGLSFRKEFSVDALIGVTLDQDHVVLVSIRETVKTSAPEDDWADTDSIDQTQPQQHNPRNDSEPESLLLADEDGQSQQQPRGAKRLADRGSGGAAERPRLKRRRRDPSGAALSPLVDQASSPRVFIKQEVPDSYDCATDDQQQDVTSPPSPAASSREFVAEPYPGDGTPMYSVSNSSLGTASPGAVDWTLPSTSASLALPEPLVVDSMATCDLKAEIGDNIDHLQSLGALQSDSHDGRHRLQLTPPRQTKPHHRKPTTSYPVARGHERESSSSTSHCCSFCGKHLVTRNALVTHENHHRGIYRHYCDICGKGFYSLGDLKGHMASRHTADREFKCAMCPKTYAYKQHLVAHVKWAHGAVATTSTPPAEATQGVWSDMASALSGTMAFGMDTSETKELS